MEELESPLKHLRLLKNLTQQDIADALDVSRTTVMKWETGRAVPNLTIAQIKKMVEILEVPLERIPDDFGPQPIHPSSPFFRRRSTDRPN
jgi:transcriptional regulator with XRE-family HTH domain